MKHTATHIGLTRFWRAVIGLVLLVVGCFGSFAYLYGEGSWNALAHLEATQLSDIATTELLGINQYQSASPSSSESRVLNPFSPLREALSKFLPVTDALSMLQGQLLPITTQVNSAAPGQGSLFQTLQLDSHKNQKIVMGWLPDTSAAGEIQVLKDNPGVTVASPLWLSLASSDGTLQNHISQAVVNYAHQNHIQIWALVDNQFNATLSHAVLSNPTARAHLVSQLIGFCVNDHLDGINIDFEALHSQDRAAFMTFMQILHKSAQAKRIVVSVDVAPDIVFARDDAAYFHAGLAADADYVVLMAYEEHWHDDQTPGPDADVPWVTQSVEDLLDTGVPSDQLIVGVPFYTRFWYVHRDGSVSDEAISAANIAPILAQHHAASQWDNTLGLEYATYSKSDGYEEVWYATAETMKRKLQLVQGENLAGMAVWSLGLSDAKTWKTWLSGFRQILS